MLTLRSWQTPATAYPKGPSGKARIVTHRYKGYYPAYGVRGHDYYRAVNLPIRALKIGRKTWMVDDPPHWWSMEDHAAAYQGHVVCAGLGLGLIVHALHRNPRVDRITVVERERDVIDLVAPLVPKCEIIHGDFWDYDGPADGVLFDLYVGDGHALVLDAIRTYIHLLERFPQPIRIHGFNNDSFKQLGEAITEAKATDPAGRFGPDGRWLLRDHGDRELRLLG